MRLRIAPVLLLAAFGVATSACAQVSPTPVVTCVIQADNPHRSTGTPTDIVGKGRMGCDATGVTLSGTIRIQKKSSTGTWSNVKSTSFSAFTTTKDKEYTRQAAMSCQSGTFRTAATLTASYGGQTKTATDYSGEKTNPCS